MVVPHKLTTKFDKTEYVVMEKNGNEVVLSRDGKTIRRHITHVKKLPDKTKEEGQNETCEILQDEERYQIKDAPEILGKERQIQQPQTSSKEDKIPSLKLGKKKGMWQLIKETHRPVRPRQDDSAKEGSSLEETGG